MWTVRAEGLIVHALEAFFFLLFSDPALSDMKGIRTEVIASKPFSSLKLHVTIGQLRGFPIVLGEGLGARSAL